MNLGCPEEGASIECRSPGAATAAALGAFSIGSETGGSIVAPAMRCRSRDFCPTFGRAGAPARGRSAGRSASSVLATRTAEDAMCVLCSITGLDAGDASSVPNHLDFDASARIASIKVGHIAKWMQERPATDVVRAALESMKTLGPIDRGLRCRIGRQLDDADPVC